MKTLALKLIEHKCVLTLKPIGRMLLVGIEKQTEGFKFHSRVALKKTEIESVRVDDIISETALRLMDEVLEEISK